jgi:hypothetical protein
MHAVFTLPECTCGLSRDNPRGPRADLFKFDAPPKLETQSINKDLNCKRRDFILTWSKQMVVSSTVAPRITTFIKGFFFFSRVNFQINNGDNEMPASIYRLFGLFLSLFWPPLSFSLNQKPFRVIMELHWKGMIRY